MKYQSLSCYYTAGTSEKRDFTNTGGIKNFESIFSVIDQLKKYGDNAHNSYYAGYAEYLRNGGRDWD
jgi:hypothetical protein